MKRLLIACIFLLPVPALAQQQPQQMTPAQLAITIDEMVNGLAKGMDQQQALIQAQQARIKELEDKYEPKKDGPKK